MPATVMVITDADVKFADTEAGLTTGTSFKCQVISAALNAEPVLNTAAATFCQGETDIVGLSKWTLELRYFQDWTIPAGLSKYLYDNDAGQKWFSIALDAASPPLATGPCRVAAGTYGGEAGSPLEATSSMPCSAKPVITTGP